MRRAALALVAAAPLALGGCLVQSKVQGRYVEDQGQCRGTAESNIERYDAPDLTPKQRNAQLVTLFADCMAKQGWQVARPKRSKVTTDGPHGPLDPYGSTATAATMTTTTTTTNGPDSERVMQSAPAAGATSHQRAVQQYHQRQQPATQAPVGQRPVETQPQLLSPSPSMAPLLQPEDSGPARYMPGRSYTPAATGGTGAGRNF